MSYDEVTKLKIWRNTVKPIWGCNPNIIGVDEHGYEIHFLHYGDKESLFGWEVDHRVPVALGGEDIFSNWRAMRGRWNARSNGILKNWIRERLTKRLS